jgi:hypothetical protein
MLCLMVFLVACRDGAGSEDGFRFRDVTKASGVDFEHFQKHRNSLLPEDVGSGAGWGDYDNDGDDDLFLVNFSGGLVEGQKVRTDRLFRNEGDFRFTDVTKESGVGSADWNTGCLWLDYDGDGFVDLFVSHFEGLRLYRNQGDGTFRDVSKDTKVDLYRRFLMGLCAADYDLDGDLDLYACGYVDFDREAAMNRPIVAGRPASWTNPVSHSSVPNLLLRNDGGIFVDVASEAGVADDAGKSMQAVFCDFNNDRFPDLYVGNDISTPDSLFLNQGDGTFKNEAGLAGVLDYRAGMGIAVGDLFGDGWLDLLVTHWVAEDNALWKNVSSLSEDRSQIIFEDVAPQLGLTPTPSPLVGWGCGLYDLDNDGFRDLFVVNGSTIEDELTEEVLTQPKLLPQSASAHRWDPEYKRFVDVSERSGDFFSHHGVARAASFSDIDQDGRMDVVVTYNGDRPILLRNESNRSGHWLQVKIEGLAGNRNGIGSQVRLKTKESVFTETILCGTSYLGNDSAIAHFGLGREEAIEWVEVRFPLGGIQKKVNVMVDQRMTIKEKE